MTGPVAIGAGVVAGGSMTPEAAVDTVAAAARPVTLDEVFARADLQRRYDRKYLVTPATFHRWIAGFDEPVDVLQIDGGRRFGYESRYFDTPDLMTYRQHRQRRRRRYKIRTRSYTGSGECCFEVKLAGRRGFTVKERAPHPITARDQVTPSACRLLTATLADHHLAVPSGLRPTLVTGYRRTTLLCRHRPVRITCDIGLVCGAGGRTVAGPAGLILVEVKSPGEYDRLDRRLSRLGVRPQSMSKYCLGLALLHPELASNPWHPVLKRHFGWHPPPAKELSRSPRGRSHC